MLFADRLRFLRPRAAAAGAALMLLVACGDDDTTSPDDAEARDYITAVTAIVDTDAPLSRASTKRAGGNAAGPSLSLSTPPTTVTATFHEGDPPEAGDGPSAEGEGASTPLVGQPFRYRVSGSAAFSTLYLWIDGASGYWQLDLPVDVQSLEMVLTLNDDLPADAFDIVSALGSDAGVGSLATTEVSATDLADADIAVTVRWTGASDVDLHVTDPNGEEVYYANEQTPEGGRLDLDSNAGCSIDNVNQETISWPKDAAPDGAYTIVVEYFSDCDQPSAPWTLTLNVQGRSAQTFTGTFNGPSANQSTTVTTFDFP
jgi:hypothetical protein